MRVLEVVTSAKWGGAQHQVVLIARELASRGHEVSIACGEKGELLSHAAAAGVPIHCLKWLSSGVSPFADGRALTEVVALIRRDGPDIVHTHSSKAGVLGRLAAAYVARGLGRSIPVVHHCHGLAWGTGRQGGVAGRAFWFAERLTGGLCSGVISVSQAVQDLVIHDGIYPRARHAVIHNGIDLEHPGEGPFTAGPAIRAALGLPSSGTLVVHIGRAVPGKGHGAALDALEIIAASGDGDMHLLFVGDGPLIPSLAKRIASSPLLRGRAHLLGFRTDVGAILRASDLMCLPSAAEGLPLVIIEAMAACLPVIATTVGGIPELVVDGFTGLLVPSPPPSTLLAQALLRLHNSPAMAAEMGRAGRQRAERLFSLQNTSRIIDFLDDIAQHAQVAA